MNIAILVQELRVARQRDLEKERVPDGMCHRFDAPSMGGRVVKTKRRHIVTLAMEQFEAIEVVRTVSAPEAGHVASPLAMVVPKGGVYGYDLIAHVGRETFLHGKQLAEVARDLPRAIPLSSLFDLQHKFLFYLGHIHRQAAPLLVDYFRRRGGSTWLMDATIEPDTPMFFGISDAESRWLLDAWKIATENAEVIATCLKEARSRFGRPDRILHDLGDAMITACHTACDDVPHGVCHFHLLSDIGEDMYASPHAALAECLRGSKLHARLKEQRKGQTTWLREHVEQPRTLAAILQGETSAISREKESLPREVLLAFHQWILDHASDGHRQGFPFDPHLLYFHRRVVRASDAVGQLLRYLCVRQAAPQVLVNFDKLLREYLADPKTIAAASQYEEAFDVFQRTRTAFRLVGGGDQPLRDRYLMDEDEEKTIRELSTAPREKETHSGLPQSSRGVHAGT